MMKYLKAILLLFMLFSLSVNAHDSDKAFFKIHQLQNKVLVYAEFPWTIRNAVLKFAPELLNSKDQKDFDQTLFKYLESNLSLESSNGKQLKLEKVDFIENLSHTHQNDFCLTFSGDNLERIKNTIMFNINSTQVNYHTFNLDKEIFETNRNSKMFVMKSNFIKMNSRKIPLLIVLSSVIIFLVKGKIFE